MASTNAAAQRRAVFVNDLSQLTAVFTPPCPITWLLTTTKVPSQFPPFPTTGPASCDPPGWANYLASQGFAFYSPAICPSGFSAGCTVGSRPSDQGFPPITAGETAMYCVPSGFTCTSDTTDFRGGVWGYSRTASGKGASVTVGPAIQIRWQEHDLSLLATDPMTPAPSPAAEPTATLTSSLRFPLNTAQVIISSSPTIPATSTVKPSTSTSMRLLTLTPLEVPQTSSSSSATNTATETGFGEHSADNSPVSGTTTAANTSESLPSPLSDQPNSQTSVGLAGTPSASGGNVETSTGTAGSSANVASSTSTAAMALSGILITMILGFLAVAAVRRYRRYRAGEIEAFIPIPMVARIRRLLSGRSSGILPQRNTAQGPCKHLGAELDTHGPIPELGPGNPLGTKENPAELAGASSARNSWVSHVSRIFSVRLKKEVWSV
ncbi:hypothetical protein GGR54DRAFT_559971 [Hypoxylon sp. NC1633]|nr:hypothetical protein GGR54DRAFT_559971 [Hypoxylon sp. NC1633]